ncbi:MAG: maleylpyruvate isomerase N-terminal domain-containing protein [Actinomycetota bacterium]|nr:maleylpyruvate isomerase N-terminal domain-containing protein [Actinomycetota bacterium]
MTASARIDIRDARRSLVATAQRNGELIGSLDMKLRVRGSEWTVGETSAHLIIALRGFTGSVTGDDREWQEVHAQIPTARTPERIAAMNRLTIAAEPQRSPSMTAGAITDGVDAFLAATAALAPHHVVATPWYGDGDTLTVAKATCLLLGEQVLHGYDIARTAGQKWPITRQDAVLVFEAVRDMLPKMADPNTLGQVTATYEIRLGRTARFVVHVADGAAIVENVAGQRIDCHVLAEPVAMLLVGYGRINQWRAIGKFKMFTWGRRPWLAFRFTSFFSHP